MEKAVIVFDKELAVDLLPWVNEAIAALGYIKPEAASWLAGMIKSFWLSGSSGYELRRNGTEMSKERKKQFSLGHSRMSEEVWEAYTDKGKANPLHGLDITFLRISRNVYRIRERHKIQRCSEAKFNVFEAVEVIINSENYCQDCMALVNRHFQCQHFPLLPLQSCDAEACGCTWRQISKTEQARSNLTLEMWPGQ